MDDGDRGAPVALARNAPVAQAPGGLLFAQALGAQVGGDGVDRFLVREAVVLAGVDGAAGLLVAVPFLPGVGGVLLAGHVHDLLDRQPVFPGEGEVALVVRRHAHDGAVAVAHEHVVADPDFDVGAGDRVRDVQARGHAFLFARGHFGLGRAAQLALLDERRQLRVGQRGLRGQGVLRRHGAEGHAHDGVGAGGEDVQLAVLDQLAVRAGDLVGKAKRRPSDLPIQFSCIRRTRSGQPGRSFWTAPSSSSA